MDSRLKYIFFICVLFTMPFAKAAPLYQPLGKVAYLTSSFGEDRGSRYHAGIDFSTSMEEGWPIIAPSNGFVEFAARGAFGYGRHIKFKTNDKHVWLFAHLSEFNSKIDTLIREELLKTEKPRAQLSMKIPFKKGDTLAYSGSTGIGNPHLHVEYRTKDSKVALNPCKKMQCPDTISPLILDAAPFDSGFAVRIVDYSREPFENPMSIYSLNIYQDKNLIFSKKYDSLAFAPKEMAKIKDDLIKVEGTDSVGNWHFIKVQNDKWAGAKIRVVAKDFANNSSSKELTIKKTFLKLKPKEPVEILIDTVPPSLGTAYLKWDFAERPQCRIPVSDPLSGFDFDSADIRDIDGNWIIFDYHLNTKELVVEKRDFDFSDPLKIRVCDKAKNCTEREIKCI